MVSANFLTTIYPSSNICKEFVFANLTSYAINTQCTVCMLRCNAVQHV